ncbi:Bromodomain transcription factor [Forsythia ovata]|uniref:Bromodomain transcription factor n=1 Tax=Forsythia ovata TaxID=205694 RepID=A0ABD1UET1_9LAMI
MSDEGGKASVGFLNEKESVQTKKKNKKLGIDDFSEAIARIAVAQVCESLGFQSFQQCALNTLSDVGVRYIREVGRTANFYANLANRNEGNVFDVIQGLEDLDSIQGFSGGSDSSHCLSGSAVVRDIIRFIGEVEEIPFVYSIPRFPVVKERKLNPIFKQTGESPPEEHIPDWLPKFPDPETCKDLIMGNEKELGTGINNIIQQVEEQNKKFEMPLLNMQQKLIFNQFEKGVAVEPEDAAKAQKAAESNPFLAHPLQFGEKEVSLPVLPTKLYDEAAGSHQNHIVMDNHVSAIEQSVHITEAAWSSPSELKGVRRNILLNGRHNVQFKFESSRKSVGMPIGHQTADTEKIALWFGDDHDEKDETKRTSKQILYENGENMQEVAHL